MVERVGVEKLVTRHVSLMERLRKAQVRQDDVSHIRVISHHAGLVRTVCTDALHLAVGYQSRYPPDLPSRRADHAGHLPDSPSSTPGRQSRARSDHERSSTQGRSTQSSTNRCGGETTTEARAGETAGGLDGCCDGDADDEPDDEYEWGEYAGDAGIGG